MTNSIDYRSFLSRLDPIWPHLVHRGGRYYPDRPASTRVDWGECAFIGNGMIGASIYKKTATGLCFELGRNDAEAHNFLTGVDWCVPRIPIGDLVLTAGPSAASLVTTAVTQEQMRLGLYDAEATGEMATPAGNISWRAFEVSGKRSNGVNQWVLVKSLAGIPLRVMPNLPGAVLAHGARAFSLKPDGNGAYLIDLNKGEAVLLYSRETAGPSGEPPQTTLAPVPSEKQYENFYGAIKPGMGAQAMLPLNGVCNNPQK